MYMEDLMVMRKKILSGNVPIEELREMRSELSKKIDLGNQLVIFCNYGFE